MREFFRRLTTVFAVLLGLSSATGTALAQSAAASAAAAANPEYQALFKRMYDNPQDMAVTFQFAELAARLGDYEAAIGALERVLFYNPNLARVKVELAQLYFRIGGRETARSYLDQAIATPGVTPDVQTAAQQLLLAGDSPAFGSGFSAFVHSGMRYQTNASAGPNSALIRSFGDVTALDNRFSQAPDWNYFTLANAQYIHDFGSGIAAEFNFIGYYAEQLKLSRFDLSVAELQVGPRFALPSGFLSNASVRLYGIGTVSWLAEDPYYSGAGFGVSSRFTFNDIRFEPSYEYRDRDFDNSRFYTTSAQQTGVLQVAAMFADGKLFGTAWFGRMAGSWNRTENTAFDFNSYDRVTGDIGIPIPFTLNIFGERQYYFTPTAGFTLTNYVTANPTIDPDIIRKDREWRIGAALDIQLVGNWGLRTHVQYAETLSNLPNFDMDNLSVSFGPTFRF